MWTEERTPVTPAPPVPCSPLPDACRTPAGRTGTGIPLRQNALLNALDPGFHCVRAHWIRGLMAFDLARRIRTVMLMVPVCPESGFIGRAARPQPIN